MTMLIKWTLVLPFCLIVHRPIVSSTSLPQHPITNRSALLRGWVWNNGEMDYEYNKDEYERGVDGEPNYDVAYEFKDAHDPAEAAEDATGTPEESKEDIAVRPHPIQVQQEAAASAEAKHLHPGEAGGKGAKDIKTGAEEEEGKKLRPQAIAADDDHDDPEGKVLRHKPDNGTTSGAQAGGSSSPAAASETNNLMTIIAIGAAVLIIILLVALVLYIFCCCRDDSAAAGKKGGRGPGAGGSKRKSTKSSKNKSARKRGGGGGGGGKSRRANKTKRGSKRGSRHNILSLKAQNYSKDG